MVALLNQVEGADATGRPLSRLKCMEARLARGWALMSSPHPRGIAGASGRCSDELTVGGLFRRFAGKMRLCAGASSDHPIQPDGFMKKGSVLAATRCPSASVNAFGLVGKARLLDDSHRLTLLKHRPIADDEAHHRNGAAPPTKGDNGRAIEGTPWRTVRGILIWVIGQVWPVKPSPVKAGIYPFCWIPKVAGAAQKYNQIGPALILKRQQLSKP